MRKVLVIAAREYNAAVRTRAFLIGLLMMPLLMGGNVLVQTLMQDKDRRFAIIDRTGSGLFKEIEQVFVVCNSSYRIDPETKKESGPRIIVPLGLIMLMFMVIVMAATPLMQGLVEVKRNRVAEVLLGSVPPLQLMLGKLLGMTGVCLTISAVYLGGAWWAAHHFGLSRFLQVEMLI